MNMSFSGWSTPPRRDPYVKVEDQKASGTAGGTFTSGSYQTRTINTIVTDTHGIASLNAAFTQLTLPAGTYRILAQAISYRVDLNKLRLQNISLGTTLVGPGPNEYMASGANTTHSRAMLCGIFTLAGPSILEIQHRGQTTRATDGFGLAATFGDVEVYLVAEFWKTG